jgi:hypothetical protein
MNTRRFGECSFSSVTDIFDIAAVCCGLGNSERASNMKKPFLIGLGKFSETCRIHFILTGANHIKDIS